VIEVRGTPTGEEVAAIVGALQRLRHCELPEEGCKVGERWSLAARYPELEIDDVRSLAANGRVF
jgi:hypothetical protein